MSPRITPAIARRLILLLSLALALGGCRLLRRGPQGDDVLILPDQTRDAVERIGESRSLNRLCERAAAAVAVRHADAGLTSTDIGLAVIDLTRPRRMRLGQFRGYEGVESSELAALPLAVEALRQRVIGHLTETQVALPVTSMIVDGDAGEINAMLDLLTSTAPGDTLIGPGLEDFLDRRKTVDRSLQAQGLYGICTAHHLNEQSPTGRDRQAAERISPPVNQMTAADTARLLTLIGTGEIITPTAAGRLFATMARPAGPAEVMDRLPRDVPEGTRLWGLAAWTRRANHGAWIVALPDGTRLAVAVLALTDQDLPEVPRELAEELIRGAQ